MIEWGIFLLIIPPPPDSTLSIRGVAADSEAVGDKFTEIEEDQASLNDTLNSITNALNSLASDLNDLRKEIVVQKSIKISTSWQTVLSGDELSSGVYIVTFKSKTTPTVSIWGDNFCGIMEWYSGETNSTDANEIPLHCAGHATNSTAFYLRTSRTARSTGKMLLQIKSSTNGDNAAIYEFHFKKLLNWIS